MGGWLDRNEAAEILGLSPKTVSNYLTIGVITGELVIERNMPVYYIRREDLEAYQKQRDAKRARAAQRRGRGRASER